MDVEVLLEKVLRKILKQIDAKPIIPIECQLWDEQDIASYFKLLVGLHQTAHY